MLYDNIQYKDNILNFCGQSVLELTKKYGTPLMVFDYDKFAENCRKYRKGLSKINGAMAHYASKALCIKALYSILDREGLGADAVSVGELSIMKSAGFPLDKVCFHGNAKTDVALEFAVSENVGHIVVDNFDELFALNEIALKLGKRQDVLLRLTPNIDPHTFAAVNTGKVDSKFGVAITTGQAEEFVKKALECKGVNLCGYHTHIGSQIFELKPFTDASTIMIKFSALIKDRYGYSPEIISLGGGFGVPYLESDPKIDLEDYTEKLVSFFISECKKFNVKQPKLFIEPGRSLVANCGITLYTVQNYKEIKGYKAYAQIDGGMADNPRYALYKSPYTVVSANKQHLPLYPCTVAGCCCESGDLIQENVNLPKLERGDVLAVLTTGAYNYSMASNYNALTKPPIVFIGKAGEKLAVRREKIEDVLSLQLDV